MYTHQTVLFEECNADLVWLKLVRSTIHHLKREILFFSGLIEHQRWKVGQNVLQLL
uniref:Uncharacterized protein n=1 Tax=Enterobacter cloacae TaxID=550 RepID=A0A0E3DSZ9_ENTCL|nr:hypothetical protein [Enterobacter cloacae]